MGGCRRRAQRRHGEFHAVLRERDDVHIALDHHELARCANRRPRLEHPVELATLGKQRRFRGVEIFGLPFVEDTPAEADHATAPIMDRKHDAVAKPVVAFPGVPCDHQARSLQHLALIVGKCAGQGLPVVRRVADPETRRDRSAQATPFKVCDCALRLLELQTIEFGGLQQHTRQVEGFVAVAHGRWEVGAWNFEAGITGKLLDRIGKRLAAEFHQEADGRPVGAASEAVIELLGRAYGERRCLFAMEGTTGNEVSTRFFERHVPIDDRHDVDPAQQRLDKFVRNHGLNPAGPWHS